MENLEDDKGASEISRIPSPSSISSIHSVRPLEWDSGADIGYRCKVSSSLSTVERMALVRGTVNLLETCQPPTTNTFSPPLAHSSPFVSSVRAPGQSTGDKPTKRLVDYTICDDDSFRRVSGSCKSLDDLRRAVRKTDPLACKCASRSSNNVATPKSSSHLSASSLVTILGSRKYSNKAIQVNEGSLTKPSSISGSTSTSGVRSSIISTDNPTYTIEGDKMQSVNTSDESYNCPSRSRATNRSQSNGNSSDKGSFEYVRGSVYDVRDGSRKSTLVSDSDVDTLCSEVVDGVELVTKYVNNLRLSNKSRVIRKIVLALASNLSRAESSENSNHVNNEDGVSENQAKKPTYSNDLVVPNSAVLSGNGTSSGDIPVTSSSINNSVSISGVSRSVSDISTENHFRRSLKCRQSKSSDSSTNIGPLKEFLEKERETQLLWIKSGIDHLNNLKKLYESQKLLKENIRSLRKRQTIEITSVRTNSQKRSPNSRSRASAPSSKCQFSRNKVDNSSVSTETSHRSNKIEISRTSSAVLGRFVTHSSNRKRTQNCSNQHKRNGQFYEESVENKENISQNSLKPRSNETGPKLKPPVSYTVLFDKKPPYFASQNYTVKEEIRNEAPKENSKRNICRRKYGVSKSSTKPGFTLHDYLLKNKPEYVNKAESRRKCLEKISELRHLRDQNRGELVATLHNEPDKVNCIVPPPLSIIRIFDDRSIKQSTARKYQQLPEVQNKKLELKREENFRRNRIMAKIFTKKLQKKVLKGQVNLSNTVNLISV